VLRLVDRIGSHAGGEFLAAWRVVFGHGGSVVPADAIRRCYLVPLFRGSSSRR
jgi:hypothetical protein